VSKDDPNYEHYVPSNWPEDQPYYYYMEAGKDMKA
jgi:hypothetical protein